MVVVCGYGLLIVAWVVRFGLHVLVVLVLGVVVVGLLLDFTLF